MEESPADTFGESHLQTFTKEREGPSSEVKLHPGGAGQGLQAHCTQLCPHKKWMIASGGNAHVTKHSWRFQE